MSSAQNQSAQSAARSAPDQSGNSARKKAFAGITALIVLAAIAYGVYWAMILNHFESTDDAYVQGNLVQITPQIGGTIVALNADDTDRVEAGQVLVTLDPADARVALEQAEAQLAQAVREVRSLYANNSTLKAQIAMREAELVRARSEQARARDDVRRRAPLFKSGAVGAEEFNHSRTALANARSSVLAAESAVTAAREQLAANLTLTEGTAVDQHPKVKQAAAQVREAFLALNRTELRAPVSGFVARRSAQLGQRVAAGTPLMSVVPLDRLWVDANFKESQLGELRIGQPVNLEADVYGSKVEYHGTIQGMGAGTGAAFSLLPAQNATGNWIKIVQRVPVRIQLDPEELVSHPLRVGLSMTATVDVSDTDGAILTEGTHLSSASYLQSADEDASAASARVREIIVANGGAKPTASLGRAADISSPVADAGAVMTAGRVRHIR